MAAVCGRDMLLLLVSVLLLVHLARGSSGGTGTASSSATEEELHGMPRWAERRLQELVVVATKSADAVVSKDGSSPFSSIQKAIDQAPRPTGKGWKNRYYTVYVKAGVYEETVTITRNFVVIFGDGIDRTIITGSRSRHGTGHDMPNSATVCALGHRFMARDLTVQNTAGPDAGQAVALRLASNQSVCYQCAIEGFQDSLYAEQGLQFYQRCQIKGTVDFVFGHARAVFQDCDLLVRKNMPRKINAVTAQGRNSPDDYSGFVFQGCRVRKERPQDNFEGVETYLGRPWKTHSHVVFMRCVLDDIVHPAGWAPWNATTPVPSSVYYGEYHNTGNGADTKGRVKWEAFHVITDAAVAQNFSADNFIHASDWLPGLHITYNHGIN